MEKEVDLRHFYDEACIKLFEITHKSRKTSRIKAEGLTLPDVAIQNVENNGWKRGFQHSEIGTKSDLKTIF